MCVRVIVEVSRKRKEGVELKVEGKAEEEMEGRAGEVMVELGMVENNLDLDVNLKR